MGPDGFHQIYQRIWPVDVERAKGFKCRSIILEITNSEGTIFNQRMGKLFLLLFHSKNPPVLEFGNGLPRIAQSLQVSKFPLISKINAYEERKE